MIIMRNWLPIVALLAAASLPALASRDAALQALIDRAETAPLADRAPMFVEVAERQLKAADDLYTAGNADEAQAAVKDVVLFSQKARDAAVRSDRKLKSTEIAIRKMAAKLRDIKRTVIFEDQVPLQAAADRLESFRTDLQTKMFGKGK